MRGIRPTVSAVLLAGAMLAPVWSADSASAAPCPPAGTIPENPAPAPVGDVVDIVVATVYVYAHC